MPRVTPHFWAGVLVGVGVCYLYHHKVGLPALPLPGGHTAKGN